MRLMLLYQRSFLNWQWSLAMGWVMGVVALALVGLITWLWGQTDLPWLELVLLSGALVLVDGRYFMGLKDSSLLVSTLSLPLASVKRWWLWQAGLCVSVLSFGALVLALLLLANLLYWLGQGVWLGLPFEALQGWLLCILIYWPLTLALQLSHPWWRGTASLLSIPLVFICTFMTVLYGAMVYALGYIPVVLALAWVSWLDYRNLQQN